MATDIYNRLIVESALDDTDADDIYDRTFAGTEDDPYDISAPDGRYAYRLTVEFNRVDRLFNSTPETLLSNVDRLARFIRRRLAAAPWAIRASVPQFSMSVYNSEYTADRTYRELPEAGKPWRNGDAEMLDDRKEVAGIQPSNKIQSLTAHIYMDIEPDPTSAIYIYNMFFKTLPKFLPSLTSGKGDMQTSDMTLLNMSTRTSARLTARSIKNNSENMIVTFIRKMMRMLSGECDNELLDYVLKKSDAQLALMFIMKTLNRPATILEDDDKLTAVIAGRAQVPPLPKSRNVPYTKNTVDKMTKKFVLDFSECLVSVEWTSSGCMWMFEMSNKKIDTLILSCYDDPNYPPCWIFDYNIPIDLTAYDIKHLIVKCNMDRKNLLDIRWNGMENITFMQL